MTWTREFAKGWGGKRTLICHKTTNGRFEFRIRVQGGFCTVKEWRLDVLYNSAPIISGVRFWKHSEAVNWAEGFLGQNGVTINAFRMTESY